MRFKLKSEYKPAGDQIKAIEQLTEFFQKNKRAKATLLGVTGSGKTFTMANLVRNLNLPTLVISHNKTLAAQLFEEFSRFFPENRTEYFVSFYDYYQPEAYIPQTDTYIEKDSAINDEIERLRLSTAASLMTNKDVLTVASVSCIYGLGSPEDFNTMIVQLKKRETKSIKKILRDLVTLQYQRNDMSFFRGNFRLRGDVLDIFPGYEKNFIRVEFFDEEIERISYYDALNQKRIYDLEEVIIFPAKHFVTPQEKIKRAIISIKEELEEQIKYFKDKGKELEAKRIKQRTMYDIELLENIGFCKGIENYSRHLSFRQPGEKPVCLLDYYPDDFLLIIDESHQTLPQIKAMLRGDMARKKSLIEFGFRLPSCLDNRPLSFEEVEKYFKRILFVSATPSGYELKNSQIVVEQIIRPTGLLDPKIEVKKTEGQIDDIIKNIKEESENKNRVIITTLTKRLAEDISEYLINIGIRAKYLHSDIDTLERVKILREFRQGKFDAIVGINLLREGLDLPEVSLVMILDADKTGFLRSATSLIQMIGRASRNRAGKVIMYADKITEAMMQAISETNRRRRLQIEYNKKHNITPKSIVKKVYSELSREVDEELEDSIINVLDSPIKQRIKKLTELMKKAADNLEFEKAAKIRDILAELQK